ncbi:hypothetical protein D9Q98_003682 [Chlorella vulgaris]|uniref:Uncharacterized protein n=1 Tax=Chlorella vulgaris TaxID=3077 RepID=A0A9D4YZN4_CHLVU|nr:hypothetical protein D9Q98_003682 [Chlorella vulgaris]
MEGLSHRTFQLVESLDRAVASSPDPQALAALDRAIQAGARRLSALGTRLAATLRSSNAASVSSRAQFLAACMVCRCLAIFADKFELHKAMSALCCCAALPLECGRALMAQQVVSSLGTVQDRGVALAVTA